MAGGGARAAETGVKPTRSRRGGGGVIPLAHPPPPQVRTRVSPASDARSGGGPRAAGAAQHARVAAQPPRSRRPTRSAPARAPQTALSTPSAHRGLLGCRGFWSESQGARGHMSTTRGCRFEKGGPTWYVVDQRVGHHEGKCNVLVQKIDEAHQRMHPQAQGGSQVAAEMQERQC